MELPLNKLRNRLSKFRLDEDNRILLICMGIALVFWLFVKLSERYSCDKQVVFRFSLPEDKIFTNLPPEDLIAKLNGTGWQLMLDFLLHRKITLGFDLQDDEALQLSRGRLRAEIQKKLAANTIEVVETTYDNIDMVLETKVRKKVAVIVPVEIEFAPGYRQIGVVKINPDSIWVTGPGSKVDPIQKWIADSVFLKNVNTTAKPVAQLTTPEKGVMISRSNAQITIEVEQFTEKSVFVPILIKNTEDSLQLFPQRVKITFTIGVSDFDSVSSNDFTVEADLQKTFINRGKNTAPISLTRFPIWIKNPKLAQESVEFFIIRQ